MTKFTAFMALIAASATLFLSSSTVEAVPMANPTIPAFSIYTKDDFQGKSKFLSKYGCQNHGLGQVASVHHHTGPKANLVFYTGKKCTGTATHQMNSDTVKRMGGPYESMSVRITSIRT